MSVEPVAAAPGPARPQSTAGRRGPSRIVLVRHGESLGNVADRDARAKGAGRLEPDVRDADVELSDAGVAQAEALGDYLSSLPPQERPTRVLTSPYRRAAATAAGSCAQRRRGRRRPGRAAARARPRLVRRPHRTGIREAYPDEARRRQLLGKFYYRPPGGESWCDVLLRVRSLLERLKDREYDGAQLWIFSHQAVIMAFRLCLEDLDEKELLRIDSDRPLGNCSMTRYEPVEGGRFRLFAAGDTAAVDRAAGVPQTTEPESAGKGTRAGS